MARFACRGKEGITLQDICRTETLSLPGSDNAKTMQYSGDGSLLAWSTPEMVFVSDGRSGSVVHTLKVAKVVELLFSPKHTYLALWVRPVQDEAAGRVLDNLTIWNVETEALVTSYLQRSQSNWAPQWSSDESIFARLVGGAVHFYNGSNIEAGVVNKLPLPDIAQFKLSPGPAPHKVAVFLPGKKGYPSYVRLYNYPSFQQPVSSKSFSQGEKVSMVWNHSGTRVLVLAQTEVDATGRSYFGETHMYFLDANGKFDCNVILDKDGPIHDFAWSPNGKEFVIIYGFMPPKAKLFDLKCNPTFDFGSGSWNSVQYDPFSRVLCLAGFGNLAGEMDIWIRDPLQRMCSTLARNASALAWCPDGVHIMTATLSPRLRVDNGYKVMNYRGEIVDSKEFAELYQVEWQPAKFSAAPLDMTSPSTSSSSSKGAATSSSSSSSTSSPAPKAYVPPHLRGKPGEPKNAPRKLHELYEEQQRAESRRKPVGSASSANSESSSSSSNSNSGSRKTQEPASDVEKKVKNLTKKVRQIELLKEQQSSGKTLDPSQVEKIKSLPAVQKELAALQAQQNSNSPQKK